MRLSDPRSLVAIGEGREPVGLDLPVSHDMLRDACDVVMKVGRGRSRRFRHGESAPAHALSRAQATHKGGRLGHSSSSAFVAGEGTVMRKTSLHDGDTRRPNRTLFAAAALIAGFAATTLTACGPRDGPAALAGGGPGVPTQAATGQPVPITQPVAPVPAQVAAVAPTPAYAPPPPAAMAPAAPPPSAYAAAPQPVPMTSPTYPADSPQLQPTPSAHRVAPAPRPAPSVQTGSIASIEPIKERPQGSGAGAVVGGVLGAVVGNQFGHGIGRAAMTGVGAAGGAIAGNNVERNYKTAVVGYRVNVRLDNGHTRTFQRTSIGNLHVGDRVRVDANGFGRS